MAIWLIRPKECQHEWQPWYDKCFGFVICAESEDEARTMAAESGETGDEGRNIWLDRQKTLASCIAQQSDHAWGVIMRDFWSA